MSFCDWLIPPSAMSSSFTPVAACVTLSVLFQAARYSVVWLDHGHPLGCLCRVHTSAAVSDAAVDVGAHRSVLKSRTLPRRDVNSPTAEGAGGLRV